MDDRLKLAAVSALDLWADFPVDREPRPVVLTASALRVDGRFRDGNAKRAFCARRFVGHANVAEEALEVLRLNGERVSSGLREPSQIAVLQAVKTTAVFRTDRGPRQLTAWQITTDGVTGTVVALDREALDSCWRPTMSRVGVTLKVAARYDVDGAELRSGGLSLLYRFIGPDLGTRSYSASVAETRTAVTVIPVPSVSAPSRYSGWAPLKLCTQTIVVRLNEALGNRVVVDLNGHPIEVSL
jgi:hypothetical protein